MRYLLLILILIPSQCFSQQDTINEKNVKEILSYLASDKMKGRVNYSKEQLQAAEFIADKFREYGLWAFPGFQYYYQPFITETGYAGTVPAALKWNGKSMHPAQYINLSTKLLPEKKQLADYRLITVNEKLPDSILFEHWNDARPLLIWVKKEFKEGDSVLSQSVAIPDLLPYTDILIVAAPDNPENIELLPNEKFYKNQLHNIVAVMPGNSKASEAIIFSAHYDHVAKNMKGIEGLYNGANDNASGTTAVLELARYFSMRNDNERTIIFCVFAGEELGLFGSSGFVSSINPDNIKAVINIEMIGMTNRSGENSFFITGPWFSNLESIMKKNLKGEKFKIADQGIDDSNLFQRSDNFPFYKKGMVAHTLMCSDDKEDCYHEDCDDVDRINIANMTNVIKAIAKSCRTIISGVDTPRRR